MPFYVERFDRSFEAAAPTQLKLTVERYSGVAVGGFEDAEISVEGPVESLWEVLRWLRHYWVIRNENFNIVWAGFVTLAQANFGGLQIGKTLDGMANRIAVAYSEDDPDGAATRGTTAYADDTESQLRYGIKELLQQQGDADATEAVQQRDDALSKLSAPIYTIDLLAGDTPGATAHCSGLWSTLGWKLYDQPGGVERFDATGNYEHLLGWGFTDTVIGFESSYTRIHDLNGRLAALRKDDIIIVTGASNAGNNGAFTVTLATTTDKSIIGPTSTISFNVTDDIMSSGHIFGPIQAHELIQVTGSSVSGNNRYYFANDELADDHITVLPATIANSVAGASVTVKMGHSVEISSALTTEYPANSVTLKAIGTIIAQGFTLSVNVPFTVAEVYIRVKKVGNPADGVQVFIEADSSGSPSNITMESATVAGSAIGTDMQWVKFTFTNTTSLSYATPYWLVAWRTGANSPTDYYVIDLAEDNDTGNAATYTGGAVKLWNGTAWIARSVNADMPFQVWGKKETTGQITDMITAGSQFHTAIDIQDASGLAKRLYRDADQTAQTEIETLLRAGVSGGRRLITEVTPDRVVHVYQEPTYNSDNAPLLGNDSKLQDVTGARWEPGKLPFGEWLTLTGVPSNVDELEGLGSVFIERAEYDARNGKFTALTPKGAPNPWDVVKLA